MHLRGSFSSRVLARRGRNLATSLLSPSTGSANAVVVATDCSLYASSLIRFIPKGSDAPSALLPNSAPKARSMKSGLSPDPSVAPQMTLLGGGSIDRDRCPTLGLLVHDAGGKAQACLCSRIDMPLVGSAS